MRTASPSEAALGPRLCKKTLLSFIQGAKPRRAFSTTYTFSVFGFETFVLRTLRKCGCEQIDVLIYAREVQRSTVEATSLRAGNAYRVVPVGRRVPSWACR